VPLVEADGRNTAVVLENMKLSNDEVFERVEAALRQLIPSVERIRIQRETMPARDSLGSKVYFDFRGAPRVPAHNASHGTLIVLALLTILHDAGRPDLLLIDDFDHALHPRAQMELVRMLKGLLALDEFKELQIVATTHSPYTLDELDPSEVQAFALNDDGTVVSKRLSDHPEAKKMKGSLRSGQLWSLDPERDWVRGNKAA
jgi:predicted ATPase